MMPDTLNAIRQLAGAQPNFKQSTIINRLLTALFECADETTIWRMCSEEHAYEKGFVVKWEANAEALRQRAHQIIDGTDLIEFC